MLVMIPIFILAALLVTVTLTSFPRLEGLSNHVTGIIYGDDKEKLWKLDINATYDNLKFWKFWDYDFEKMVVYKD